MNVTGKQLAFANGYVVGVGVTGMMVNDRGWLTLFLIFSSVALVMGMSWWNSERSVDRALDAERQARERATIKSPSPSHNPPSPDGVPLSASQSLTKPPKVPRSQKSHPRGSQPAIKKNPTTAAATPTEAAMIEGQG